MRSAITADHSEADPGSRRSGRESALALLYEAESKAIAVTVLLAELPAVPDRFADRLVRGVEVHRERIDILISTHAIGWEPTRMPVLDLVIARIAVYELIDEPEVPVAVILSEAVELAQRYSTEGSGPFLNGILAAIGEEVRG